MNPAELQAWLTKHGEMDHSARSVTGQDMIFAKDGSRVVLTRLTPDTYRVDDIYEKDNPGASASAPTATAAPADASADAPAAAPASAGVVAGPGGAPITSQEELGARLAQNPNLQYQGQHIVTKTVPPKYQGLPATQVQVPTATWLDPTTGHTLTAEVQPGGGSYIVTQDQVVPANKMTPAQAAGAPGTTTETQGTPTGRKNDDGSPEYDNTQPRQVIKDRGGNVIHSEPLTGAPLTAWELGQQRSRNGGLTDKEKQDQQAAAATQRTQAQQDADRAKAGQPTVKRTTDEKHPGYVLVETITPATATTPGGAESHYEKADAPGTPVQAPPGAPTVRSEDVVSGGVHYTRVIKTTPGGDTSITNYGPDGKPIGVIPGEGSGNQGPPLPDIVLGQSQTALRAYKDRLNSDVQTGVTTPAVADKRWKEAIEIANFAITEAQTQQRDEESRRNADVNLRTNAMTNAVSGFDAILSEVGKMNAQLPEGSKAGGDAFVALLGLQQMQAKRMGAYAMPFSGGAPRSAQANQLDAAGRATTSGFHATVDATNAQPGPRGAPDAPQSMGPPAPPAVQGTPSEVGDTGAPPVPVADPAPAPTDPAADPSQPAALAPNYQEWPALAQFAPPPEPMPQQPAVQLNAPDPGPNMMPPAMRAAQIATTPPWRLSNDDWEYASRNGLLDQARMIPGAVG